MRKRKCANRCGKEAKFMAALKAFCSYECTVQFAKRSAEKIKEAEEKAFRKETKERKRKFNEGTKKYWMDKATKECHKYIRERDESEPCISCGRFDHEIDDVLTGGKWDAGHYLSKGARPELRFDPLNIHKQCKSCNAGSGKYAKKNHTVQQSYRERLIEKVGLDTVEWLEGPHEAKRYRLDDFKELYEHYKGLNRINANN